MRAWALGLLLFAAVVSASTGKYLGGSELGLEPQSGALFPCLCLRRLFDAYYHWLHSEIGRTDSDKRPELPSLHIDTLVPSRVKVDLSTLGPVLVRASDEQQPLP